MDPLQQIAAVANTISSSALRILLELTAHPDQPASGRALALRTGLSHSNVRVGMAELATKQLIISDGGSATRPPRIRLAYLELTPLPKVPGVPVPEIGTPPEQLCLKQAQGVPEIGTEVCLNQAQGVPKTGTHPRAREIDSIDVNPIDRLLRANPKRCDAGALAHWRSWLHGYQAKLGREPNPHPPDDRIVAQWMACGEHQQLERLLYDLMAERKQPGNSYGWFIAVALQRIHGISPEQQHKQRAQLRAVPKQQPPPLQPQAPAEQQQLLNTAVDLQAQIAQLSQRKAMR